MHESQSLTYASAANAALRRALKERPEVLVYGEDVAIPGGVFGVTKGLVAEFGDRVFDTPISESAILGSAVGAAIVGMRPVVEIMWSDFLLVALDQLVNQAANVRYLSSGEASAAITVRTQQGMAPGACAQHSQSLEALLCHTPGLRVAMPSTAQDAYSILLSSIWCDDPVVVIENRTLYHGSRAAVSVGAAVEPIGGSRIVSPGDDITIVSWGAMVSTVVDAAAELQQEGIRAEVIDARWLNPFDYATLLESIAKTRKLAVVHEATMSGGLGAEVLTRVQELGARLSHVPIRIATPDVRVPAAPNLMAALRPSAERIAQRVASYVKSTR